MKINTNNYKNIWFTSDWHIGHNKEFLYGPRGCESRDEHVRLLIDGVNKLAGRDDLIIHMGDVSLTATSEELTSWFEEINCKNFWSITGNHDNNYARFLTEYKQKFENCTYRNLGPFKEAMFMEPSPVVGEKARRFSLTLCHYPLQIWNKSHHGSWSLCGHSHNSFEGSSWMNPVGKKFDCGVEAALEFDEKVLFSWEDVKAIMSTKQIFVGDHHNSKTS